jgi:hypothetical protein
MLASDPRGALALASERVQHLRESAQSGGQPRSAAPVRRIFAASLRNAANRLDPTPLVQRTA